MFQQYIRRGFLIFDCLISFVRALDPWAELLYLCRSVVNHSLTLDEDKALDIVFHISAKCRLMIRSNKGLTLHIVVEESQSNLVSSLILFEDFFIFQVSSRSHPSVNLSRKRLHMLRRLQVCLKFLNIIRRLIFRS